MRGVYVTYVANVDKGLRYVVTLALKGRRLHTLWCIIACVTLQSSCYNASTDSFQSLQVFSYPDLLHFCCQKSLLGIAQKVSSLVH